MSQASGSSIHDHIIRSVVWDFCCKLALHALRDDKIVRCAYGGRLRQILDR